MDSNPGRRYAINAVFKKSQDDFNGAAKLHDINSGFFLNSDAVISNQEESLSGMIFETLVLTEISVILPETNKREMITIPLK